MCACGWCVRVCARARARTLRAEQRQRCAVGQLVRWIVVHRVRPPSTAASRDYRRRSFASILVIIFIRITTMVIVVSSSCSSNDRRRYRKETNAISTATQPPAASGRSVMIGLADAHFLSMPMYVRSHPTAKRVCASICRSIACDHCPRHAHAHTRSGTMRHRSLEHRTARHVT